MPVKWIPIICTHNYAREIMAECPRTFLEAFPPTPPRDDGEDDVVDNVAPEAEIDEVMNNNADAFSDEEENNDALIQTIRDNIISPNTHKTYLRDLLQLLRWVQINENDWLTEHGNNCLTTIIVRVENETDQQYRTRSTTKFEALLRESSTHAVAHLDRIDPETYVKFILTLRHPSGAFLSRSAYGNKRAALNHFFRLHNRIGFDNNFKAELTNMFKGLYRQIALGRRAQQRRNVNNNGVENTREGKAAMSVLLYTSLCEWLLKWGTSDGIFAYCYLILSWNLACRCNNTARIKFTDIDWSQSFDSFSILFSQTKTDQFGEEAKYPRHIYANPMNPLVCPVLGLAIYLSSCFHARVRIDNYLFPGESQDARFAVILQRIVNEKWAQISQIGYQRGDIGTHSIRKGAVSYASSLPGGPSAASVCIRAGWTMGKVNDIYMRYVSSGDQFVGRCLSLLSVLRVDFASSPPFFIDSQQDWIDNTRKLQFKSVGLINGMEKITTMCLASILYHYNWTVEFLAVNNLFITASYIHRTQELVAHQDSVKVTHPWNDSIHHFSGIPPHVVTMQEILKVQDQQEGLAGDITSRIEILLQRMGIDGTRMSEQNMTAMFDSLRLQVEQVSVQLQNGINAPLHLEAAEGGNLVADRNVFTLHMYDGTFKRIPLDWRFPRCNICELWRHWWIGNTVRNIPPLRCLEASDVNHLDHIELSEEELHGRTGNFRNQRRMARKTLCDMKFIMRYTLGKIEERNALPEQITPVTVDQMFHDVADLFNTSERSAQIRWESVVRRVRRERRANTGVNDGLQQYR